MKRKLKLKNLSVDSFITDSEKLKGGAFCPPTHQNLCHTVNPLLCGSIDTIDPAGTACR